MKNGNLPDKTIIVIDFLNDKARKIWSILYLAAKKFGNIDGAQRAGSTAYFAFFSLFPLIILIVTVASMFINWDKASQAVIDYIQGYVPIGEEIRQQIFGNLTNVVKVRGQAGLIALVMLIWVAIQFFTTLISATNRAWGTEDDNWWQLPLKSLVLLCITICAILIGILVPLLAKILKGWLLPEQYTNLMISDFLIFLVSNMVVFLCLCLFYKLAPRRPTQFSEVWIAAIISTILLRVSESLFLIYLNKFSTLNAVYGSIGGIMALLLWIYLSSWIFIFGVCLCAAQAEEHPRKL
jgi:Ca2+-transporting ATPase